MLRLWRRHLKGCKHVKGPGLDGVLVSNLV